MTEKFLSVYVKADFLGRIRDDFFHQLNLKLKREGINPAKVENDLIAYKENEYRQPISKSEIDMVSIIESSPNII